MIWFICKTFIFNNILILVERLGKLNLSRDRLLAQYVDHPSFAGKIFDMGLDGIINEYIATVLHTMVFGTLLYFLLTTVSYFFFFKIQKEKYLPKMNLSKLLIWNDIKLSLWNIFFETFLVSLLRISLPRYSMIYYDINDYGLLYIPFSIFLHVIFDETCTYWIHRWLHTYPNLYVKLHRYHHISKEVSPFTGFAFHPLDAFAQAIPTFTSSFFFPVHMNVVLVFSIMTTAWAISIHDNVPALPCKLFLYATHHTIHHEPGQGQLKNLGKFTSVWDRIMDSYEDPDRIHYGWKEQSPKIGKWKHINDQVSNIFGPKAKSN